MTINLNLRWVLWLLDISLPCRLISTPILSIFIIRIVYIAYGPWVKNDCRSNGCDYEDCELEKPLGAFDMSCFDDCASEMNEVEDACDQVATQHKAAKHF